MLTPLLRLGVLLRNSTLILLHSKTMHSYIICAVKTCQRICTGLEMIIVRLYVMLQLGEKGNRNSKVKGEAKLNTNHRTLNMQKKKEN